jgi:hypothetical protein
MCIHVTLTKIDGNVSALVLTLVDELKQTNGDSCDEDNFARLRCRW